MNILMQKLDFKRSAEGVVPFTEYNLSLLTKYVIPVISNNAGWSTEELDEESFLEDPDKWRDDINATVQSDSNGEVYVAMDGENPVGLLEYIAEDFEDLSEKDFAKALKGMTADRGHVNWEKLLKYDFLAEEVLDQYHGKLVGYLKGKRFYRSVGVVVLPSLQGKKSGVSDSLYGTMSNGVILGWTSTPFVIAKRNKLYQKTIFFPLFNEKINDLAGLACLVVIAARTYSRYPEILDEFFFGVKTYKGFALRNKKEYMDLSKSFLDKGKISEDDLKRLDYILDFKKGQGAILSVA